jgi:Spy/CpxP family protein refolding chaperone
MEVKMKRCYCTALFITLLSIAAFSQVKRKQEMKEEDPHKLIEAIKIWKISEFLDLDDEQMATFFPKLKKIEKHRRESFKERHDILEKLHKQLDKKESDETIRKTIDELLSFERQSREREEELREEVMSVLTVTQQAKLLIFEERFEREIRNIIKEMRKERMGPPGDF